jgi:outer membrane protein assembly factor BamB
VRRLLLVAAAVLALAPHAAAAVDPTSWPSYGYDNQLSNAIQTNTLTQDAVRRLQLDWTTQLDGPVFAQPLAATVDRQLLVFAATEAGTAYAVSASTGKVIWQRNLGVIETRECGTWGITSTGVIDVERRLLFEISADGTLHALDLATGSEASGYPITLITNYLYEYVWGGLRIANDRLYVVNASYCDVGPPGGLFPEGRMFTIPLAQPQAFTSWDPVPGPGNLGGMWGWGGVSVDPGTGRVFTGVGNSSVWSDECGCYVDNAGYGNKLVELLPDLSAVVDSNDPGIAPTGDSDFGAAPLLFHPQACPGLAAANNKNGTLYIWNRERLSAGPIVSIPLGDGIAAFVGSPGWSETQQMLYAAQSVIRDGNRKVGNGITAWHADPGCGFRPIWNTSLGDGNQATPLVVGNTVFATGGRPGSFYALRAGTGDVLWKHATEGRTVAAMISVGGAVFGADTAGMLYAFDPAPPPRGTGSPARFPN